MDDNKIYNGNLAREVLDNEVFQWAMTQIRDEVIQQWASSPVRDADGREKLWLILKASEKFEAILKTTLDTGKLAMLDREHQRKRKAQSTGDPS